MIELNLTYEESKKILELGYDFSKICIEWQHNFYPPNGDPSKGKIVKWFRLGEHLVNPTLASMLTHHELDLEKTYTIDIEEALADLKNYKTGDEYTPLIPIIPKAALETCFMGVTFYEETEDMTRLSHTYTYRQYSKNRFEAHYPSIETKLHPISHLCRVCFSSASQAFIWGHGKFPKQLKKKFNEVMA